MEETKAQSTVETPLLELFYKEYCVTHKHKPNSAVVASFASIDRRILLHASATSTTRELNVKQDDGSMDFSTNIVGGNKAFAPFTDALQRYVGTVRDAHRVHEKGLAAAALPTITTQASSSSSASKGATATASPPSSSSGNVVVLSALPHIFFEAIRLPENNLSNENIEQLCSFLISPYHMCACFETQAAAVHDQSASGTQTTQQKEGNARIPMLCGAMPLTKLRVLDVRDNWLVTKAAGKCLRRALQHAIGVCKTLCFQFHGSSSESTPHTPPSPKTHKQNSGHSTTTAAAGNSQQDPLVPSSSLQILLDGTNIGPALTREIEALAAELDSAVCGFFADSHGSTPVTKGVARTPQSNKETVTTQGEGGSQTSPRNPRAFSAPQPGYNDRGNNRNGDNTTAAASSASPEQQQHQQQVHQPHAPPHRQNSAPEFTHFHVHNRPAPIHTVADISSPASKSCGSIPNNNSDPVAVVSNSEVAEASTFTNATTATYVSGSGTLPVVSHSPTSANNNNKHRNSNDQQQSRRNSSSQHVPSSFRVDDVPPGQKPSAIDAFHGTDTSTESPTSSVSGTNEELPAKYHQQQQQLTGTVKATCAAVCAQQSLNDSGQCDGRIAETSDDTRTSEVLELAEFAAAGMSGSGMDHTTPSATTSETTHPHGAVVVASATSAPTATTVPPQETIEEHAGSPTVTAAARGGAPQQHEQTTKEDATTSSSTASEEPLYYVTSELGRAARILMARGCAGTPEGSGGDASKGPQLRDHRHGRRHSSQADGHHQRLSTAGLGATTTTRSGSALSQDFSSMQMLRIRGDGTHADSIGSEGRPFDVDGEVEKFPALRALAEASNYPGVSTYDALLYDRHVMQHAANHVSDFRRGVNSNGRSSEPSGEAVGTAGYSSKRAGRDNSAPRHHRRMFDSSRSIGVALNDDINNESGSLHVMAGVNVSDKSPTSLLGLSYQVMATALSGSVPWGDFVLTSGQQQLQQAQQQVQLHQPGQSQLSSATAGSPPETRNQIISISDDQRQQQQQQQQQQQTPSSNVSDRASLDSPPRGIPLTQQQEFSTQRNSTYSAVPVPTPTRHFAPPKPLNHVFQVLANVPSLNNANANANPLWAGKARVIFEQQNN